MSFRDNLEFFLFACEICSLRYLCEVMTIESLLSIVLSHSSILSPASTELRHAPPPFRKLLQGWQQRRRLFRIHDNRIIAKRGFYCRCHMRVGNEPCEDWQKQPLGACSQLPALQSAHGTVNRIRSLSLPCGRTLRKTGRRRARRRCPA